MKKQSRKIIKIGFDLDGVLLYNPTRIFRPIIYFLKKYFLKRDVNKFYYPKTKIEQLIWLFLHKTSLFPQPGIDDIKKLIRAKKIKAYIISARYEFLEMDFYRWIKKIDKEKLFSGYFYNTNNEQPHLFKKKMIKKLKLDIFVEDNWDIVKKLKIKNQKLKVFWIYNLFDRKIHYNFKYPHLKAAINSIKKNFLREKNKILIVSDYFHPHWTGISKSIYNLTRTLKNKFDFTVLTVRFKNNLKKEENLDGVRIIREDSLVSFSRLKYSFSMIFKFIALVKNYDLVFLNSPLSNILPLTLIAKIFNKKVIIFHQGDLILTSGIFNRIIEIIYFISTFFSFLLANKVSTYTTDYAYHSSVLKYFIKKFTPMIMPIVIRPQYNKDQNKVIKKLIDLKNKKKIIFGFAGRFVEEKGFDILLEAMPKVIKDLPQSHFVFAGKKKIDYEKTFENLLPKIKKLKSHITFLGLLNDDQLASFYKMIDFIVVSSRSDCFPIVQAEAMSLKKPSIVSDIPGASYLVKNSNFGLIFKNKDPNDLAKKLIEATRLKDNFLKNYRKLLKILNPKKNVAKIIQNFNE